MRLRIEAIDRVGLLRDVTTKLSEDKINIAWVVTRENDDATVSMELTIHIGSLAELNRVFSRVEGIRGVTSATVSPAARCAKPPASRRLAQTRGGMLPGSTLSCTQSVAPVEPR